MTAVQFKATIALRGINPFISVSAEQAQVLAPGWRKPLPVTVQLNGGPDPAWRINMMPAGGGSFYLYLDNAIRKPTNTKVGDEVMVTLWFDDEYRSGPIDEIPDYLAQTLAGNSKAAENWDKLAPSRRKEVLRYLARLHSSHTRDRNLLRLMEVLEGQEKRYMARLWRNGG